MEYLHLEASHSLENGKSKLVTHLHGNGKKIEIFYEFDRVIPWSDSSVLDGNVFAILLYAMSLNKPLKVHGAISRTAMRNMEELQLVWRCMKPDIYKKIEIIPDRIDDTRKIHEKERAISAFSGGVDASFTALLHTKVLPDSLRYPLDSVVMVHGFDVEVYNMSDFERLTKRVAPILDELGLELRTIRTNSRELKLQNWDDSHGLELAACLNMYRDEFSFGIIGSSDAYNQLNFPWGSTPITDHLMCGNNFAIIHDGSGFSRTDKVALIKDFPVACKTLKVCWAGGDQSGNCGKCEKCIRTQLNFIAAGASSVPPCFSSVLDIDDIKTLKITTEGKLRMFIDILNRAKLNNVSGEIFVLLESRVAEWSPPDTTPTVAEKTSGFIKKTAANAVSAVGLETPVKKIWRRFRRALLG